MATTALSLREKLDAAQAKATRYANKLKKADVYAEKAMEAGLTVAGGAAAGALHGYMGDEDFESLAGTGVPADVAGAAILIAGGIASKGKMAPTMLAVGSGMGAVAAARYARDAIAKRQTETSGRADVR